VKYVHISNKTLPGEPVAEDYRVRVPNTLPRDCIANVPDLGKLRKNSCLFYMFY